MDLDKVPDRHKDAVLRTLLHFMDMDMRFRLMAEQPYAYNLIYGETVEVRKISKDNEPGDIVVTEPCGSEKALRRIE